MATQAQTGVEAVQRSIWAELIQVGVAYGVIVAALWTERLVQGVCMILASVLILAMTVSGRRSARELGIGAAGFRSSLWAIPLAGLAAAMMLLCSWLAGWLHPPHGRLMNWPGVGAYGIWALVQQFILQSFVFVRLESALGSGRKAVWASALLFAAAHLPSPVLTAGTLLGALFFCDMFRRFRNIYPLGMAHALLGLAIAVSAPDSLLRHMRVGIAYLRFH